MSNKLPKNFSPKSFLRARRPERFSDSIIENQTKLDRSVLEYHLSSLTSRSQETDFANFAYCLAKKEICPNILPQTGPTGGGDSKVDGETYPVADSLAMIWYTGIGMEASKERWAFAFSAKKKWRPKVQSDINKLACTKRGYVKAFFVTNQYVRDKERAEVEDSLSKECGLDVRILDLTWILDRVFSGDHGALAIEKLNLQISSQTQIRIGPLDLQKNEELKEIELRIETASQKQDFGFQFVEDCIAAAMVARSLERHRTEVDGLLSRARRVAEKYGTQHQKLVATYQTAWTNYWWHEEYDQLEELYCQAEKYAIGTYNVYDLELMLNLWNILYTAIKHKFLDGANIDIKNLTSKLISELERMEGYETRPSAALEAKTFNLHIQLVLSLSGDVSPIFNEFKNVIIKSEGLLGYSLKTLVEIMTELGSLFSDNPAYQDLIETVIKVVTKREGEIYAAKLLLNMGSQQLDRNKPYEAIRSLGRSLTKLYKQESREYIIEALYLCGAAYERVGLLWAARGTTLTAASIATEVFWTDEEITSFQAACYNRLKWLELILGRLPHLLEWHEIDFTIRKVLADKGYSQEQLSQGHIEFDSILGIHFLKTDIWTLKNLVKLPDTLKRMGFIFAPEALIFAFGEIDKLSKEFTNDMSDEELIDFVKKWRDQPASEDLSRELVLYEQRMVMLDSRILGCHVLINSENTLSCVELAEGILSALESLLSTGMCEHIIAHEPLVNIKIKKSDFTEAPFTFKMKKNNGEPNYEIQCAEFNTHSISHEMQKRIQDKIFEIIVHILARVFMIENFEETLSKLFKDECGIERAINFTSSFVTLSNVLGDTPKFSISDWFSDSNDYSLKRLEEWDASERITGKADKFSKRIPKIRKGEPPAQLKDMSQVRHDEIETVSLIRTSYWDKAGWSGICFMIGEMDKTLPILALIFNDTRIARSIFGEWRNDLGLNDKDDKLRISFIRGINQKNPYYYRVIIGSAPEQSFLDNDSKIIVTPSRIHMMQPLTSQNLDRFLKSFKKHGAYGLSYTSMPKGSSMVNPVMNSVIVKYKLFVRDAWEIGVGDLDSMGIYPDDDVIIPKGQKDAPVLGILKNKRMDK